MDREGDLEEAQKILSVNKCKRFQKVNKELIVTARETQAEYFNITDVPKSEQGSESQEEWVIRQGRDAIPNDTSIEICA